MSSDVPNRDEEQLPAFLAAAERDLPPPDRQVLDRLREESAAAFLTAHRQRQHGRRSMIRTVLGMAATLVLAAGALFWFSRAHAEPSLGQVLRDVSAVETLHARLTRPDHSGEIWARLPDRVRWDQAAGIYQVARGTQLWQVDESANRATRQPSPYFSAADSQFKVLEMLDISLSDELLGLRPMEHEERDGRDCLVYRAPVPDRAVNLEAVVDAASRRLRSVKTTALRNGQAQPVAELIVLAYNEPIADDKFQVSDILTEDGRVGKVFDVQGNASVKPVLHQRWTPVRKQLLLLPGDFVRTGARGANAAALHLVKQTTVILGPGTLLEVIKPTQLRLHQGEAEVAVPKGAAVELLGPNQQKFTVRGTQRFRIDHEQLAAVDREPAWLKGFKGTAANESIGSLLANVDGRNVPLTVGYHNVAVEIRDQIARTTIEESFVNHTNAVLEGVFHFPLPQDASIAGFGMWVGNNLVEADIVEKQRAREIYETILTEKRDPGLLEWSGGNIFKARVYPIFANSEKRIKITYTQVLPLEGGRYRYSYGLQSELLQQHPLRELAIDVKVHATVPLKDVTSPTHSARIDRTEHSAHVEFSAQEYTPTRDFEVVVEPAQQSDIVLVPHRRGDDGYFLLQLMPPTGKELAERDLLPDSGPLHLLILADTSASMDSGARTRQNAVIAALLGSLTPNDTVNVAACDVECDWAFEKPVAAESNRLRDAEQFLARRTSLGWTNLDRAFAAAVRQSVPGTQIVYIGDGVVTAREDKEKQRALFDADPVTFGQRLRRIYEASRERQPPEGLTCHAIAVGSSFEAAVLKAIAGIGGGSVRHVGGEQTPQMIALALLKEITRPVVRDLKIDFNGLRTARVYPEVLPNLPAGTQQIVLGRYLPEGRDQAGDVIVTGKLGDKPVRYSTHVSLKDAEAGNSFIPRLWARLHLDHLLEQGSSAAIKDEIIALSEEYHIITPYTSFLVLETDADRERFGVKRRFQMRDGEKFFAQGRDNANYELLQQQMKRAGSWRLGVRRGVLQELATLGRDPQLFQAPTSRRRGRVFHGKELMNAEDLSTCLPESRTESAAVGRAGAMWGDDVNGAFFFDRDSDAKNLDLEMSIPLEPAGPQRLFRLESDSALGDRMKQAEDREDELGRLGEQLDRSKDESFARPWTASPKPDFPMDEDEAERLSLLGDGLPPRGNIEFLSEGKAEAFAPSFGAFDMPAGAGVRFLEESLLSGHGRMDSGFLVLKDLSQKQPLSSNQAAVLLSLFPELPTPPRKQKEVKSSWSKEARALAQSLLRRAQLARMTGGVEILRQMESFDARWNELASRSRHLELYSPTRWLTRSEAGGGQTLVHWCDAKERAVLGKALQLGQVRAVTPADLFTPPLGLPDYSMTTLEHDYCGYTATVETLEKDRALLVLKPDSGSGYEARVLIDTTRHVILSITLSQGGKPTSTMKFEDFIEAAGTWWARRIESFDADNRRVLLTTQTIRTLTADELASRVQEELAGRERVLFLHRPLPSIAEAKRALNQLGELPFEVPFTLVLHFAGSQQWVRAGEYLQQAEKLAGNQPGVRWLYDAFLLASRRHEELKQRLLEEARILGSGRGENDDLFLADHLLAHAGGVFQANEMLTLLDTVKPVYERQPAHLRASKRWTLQRVSYLQQAGQSEEAFRLLKETATRNLRDLQVQQQYARTLADSGDYEAAYAWLTKVLTAPESKWQPHEEESLRNLVAQLLETQGRFPELVDYLAAWTKRNPASPSPYQQYLSALIRMDRVEEANALIAEWLKINPEGGEASVGRLRAAVSQALGQGHNLYTNRIEERWLKTLAEVAAAFARHSTESYVAEQIMEHGQFQQCDECRQIRKTITSLLITEADKLTPDQIQRFVSWILPNDPALSPEAWKQLADAHRKRWAGEPKPAARNQLGGALVQILTQHAEPAELLAFLHRQWREGSEQFRSAHANQLFNTLLAQPWSTEYEDEAFGLLDQLSDDEESDRRLLAQIAALHRLTDRMVEGRYQALMKKVEHPEKLPRTELQKTKDDSLRRAREGFADRLAVALRGLTPAARPWMDWLTAERVCLEVLAGRELSKIVPMCWEFLDAQRKDDKPVSADQALEHALQVVLENRYLLTLFHLATRKDANPALSPRLLTYLDRHMAAHPEDARWKVLKYHLLVALDRPKELEQALQQWIAADDLDNRWKLALGYLLAERGKLNEAIALFEAVEKTDELGPLAYRTLADWYLVTNRRERQEKALLSAFKTADEQSLYRLLHAHLRPWQQSSGPLPSELNKDVLRLFAALFEKSTYPQNYLGLLQQFYQASHDFRLLTSLADGVVGHTAGQVYPFLQGMHGVLAEIRDEATADSVVEHLAKVRERAATPVDQRALDLLEMLVERRAAELQNQPGPHVEKALAAMQRAFRRDWSPGEPRLLADLLASLGQITQPALAQEQLRELRELHGREQKGGFDRLHVATALARTQASCGRTPEAIDLLTGALKEFEDAHHGVLPVTANDSLTFLISFLESSRHFAEAEKAVFAQLHHPVHQQHKLWLTQRLYEIYHHTLVNGGEVSLGSGQQLYQALGRKVQEELSNIDPNYRHALVELLCQVYRTAHGLKLTGVAEDLKAFASRRLPEVLKVQTNNYESIVGTVARTLHDLLGARAGLAFLVERIEHEPGWLHYGNQDGWSQHGWTLAQWRDEAKDAGEATEPLLRIVTRELRQDLESRQQRNRYLYHRNYGYFWADRTDAFARTAEEVLARHKQSGTAVQYIAEYLDQGLGRANRAIEILLAAHREKLLDESGRAQLVSYLQREQRFGESIALLQPLVAQQPENLRYRVWLMHAYFRTDRQAELLALLKETDTFFHQKDRWNESVLTGLAESCLENHLYEACVAYYGELIPLHQRTQPGRGVGDGTLSQYYTHLAQAYAGLGKTAEAVDAAGGAVVCWGPRHQQRAQTLETLRQVLRQASKLDEYVARLDKQSADTGRDSPVVRKALGQVYTEKGQIARAIVQFQLALQLQPTDAETHKLLVACYDRQGDRAGLVRQLLQSVQLSRRDLGLYQELGRRYEQMNQHKEVERAYTSMVEMQPHEAESHTLLAEIRQRQDRWVDAILHWEQVARLRALEPTGFLKLAAAQIHEKQWRKAEASVRQVRGQTWPARFGDVTQQVHALEEQIRQGHKE